MAIGFKSSLFGFNKEDVLNYIESNSAAEKRRENELNVKIASARKTAEGLRIENEALKEANATISARLAVLEEKRSEILTLSEKIGKLYLTAKASAEAVVKNAEVNRRTVNEQIDAHLASLDDVHDMLFSLREQINQTAGNYTKEVDGLCDSLADARKVLLTNDSDSEKMIDEFRAVAEK